MALKQIRNSAEFRQRHIGTRSSALHRQAQIETATRDKSTTRRRRLNGRSCLLERKPSLSCGGPLAVFHRPNILVGYWSAALRSNPSRWPLSVKQGWLVVLTSLDWRWFVLVASRLPGICLERDNKMSLLSGWWSGGSKEESATGDSTSSVADTGKAALGGLFGHCKTVCVDSLSISADIATVITAFIAPGLWNVVNQVTSKVSETMEKGVPVGMRDWSNTNFMWSSCV